jgi:hypothetical protein
MPRGNPAVKLAITVDRETHGMVVRAARADRLSVSAWMTAAAQRSLRLRDGLVAVAEWEKEHGALTDVEIMRARARVRTKHADGTGARRLRGR